MYYSLSMNIRVNFILIFILITLSIPVKAQLFFTEQKSNSVHQFSLTDIEVEGDIAPFKYQIELDSLQSNVYIVQVKFTTDYPSKLPVFKLNINYPKDLVDVLWSSRSWSSNSFITVPNYSRLQSDYNIVTALSRDNENRLTIATFDDFQGKYTAININYKYRYMQFSLGHFEKSLPESDLLNYTTTVILDYRNQPYSKSVRAVADWRIRKDRKYNVPTTDFKQMPVYSLWYPLHQNIPLESVTHYFDSIVAMGFRSVLIDDGWQNVVEFNVSPTGLWKPKDTEIVSGLIKKGHQDSLNVGLWMSKPFLGNQGIIASKFDGNFLQYRNASVPLLDVRYPDVRNYLLRVYSNILKEWDIDAIYFNFLNGYYPDEEVIVTQDNGRDFISVQSALDTLKSTIFNEVNLFKPNIDIKQTYPIVGPLNSSNSKTINGFLGTNILTSIREKVVNNRLLYGNKTPFMEVMGVHPEEPSRNIALKFQSMLYGLPYVSYYSYTIPDEIRKTLHFWVKYWKSNESYLFHSEFEAENPANHYPLLIAGNETKHIYCLYDHNFDVDLKNIDFENADIINSTKEQSINFKANVNGSFEYIIQDHTGEIIDSGYLRLRKNKKTVKVPEGGLMQLFVLND